MSMKVIGKMDEFKDPYESTYTPMLDAALRKIKDIKDKKPGKLILVYGDRMIDLAVMARFRGVKLCYHKGVSGVIAMTEEQYEEFVLMQNIEKRFWRDLPSERT